MVSQRFPSSDFGCIQLSTNRVVHCRNLPDVPLCAVNADERTLCTQGEVHDRQVKTLVHMKCQL